MLFKKQSIDTSNFLFSNQQINKIFYPLLGQQILSISVNIIDSMMVSSAGEAAISGVSLINVLNNFLMCLFTSLASGGAIVIAQLLGKKDTETARSATNQLIWVCGIIAIIVSIFTTAFRYPLLNLIYGDTDPTIMKNAHDYFFYLSITYPFLSVANACYSVFRAMGNTKISLYNSIWVNLVNIVGNAILIYGFKMGAAGAAIATAISRIFSASTMMYRLYDTGNVLYIDKLFKTKFDLKIIKNICGVGIPNGVENSMFQFGKLLTQSLIASFGLVQIAANSVALSVVNIQYTAGTAISVSMSAIIGRCIGAQEKEQAKYYTIKLMKLAYAMTIAIAAITCIFSKQIAQLYNLTGETASLTIKLLIFHSIAISTVWPCGFTLPGAFRAASDVRSTMIISVCSMWVFRVFLSYVFGRYMGMGVMGVWYAMVCDWAFRAVVFVARYISGVWLTKYKPLTK